MLSKQIFYITAMSVFNVKTYLYALKEHEFDVSFIYFYRYLGHF